MRNPDYIDAAPPVRRMDAWKPKRRSLLWVLVAFALGLAVFAYAIRDRGGEDFFRADPAEPGRTYEPLPAPLPAGEGSGIRQPDAPVDERPVAVIEEPEVAPPPPPPPPAPVEQPRRADVATREPRPIADASPAPEYPVRALRRGEGGTTLVIVHIGPDGIPTSTELAQSSGSRDLDRAAQAAVRRWRFEPKIVDGRPTVGRAVVPIDFRVDR